MTSLKKQCFNLLSLFLSLSLILVDSKKQPPCYTLKMLEFRTTETPFYRLELTLHSNQTLSSITRVLKEIPLPVWHLQIVQHSQTANNRIFSSSSGGGISKRPLNPPSRPEDFKTIYNATYKTCEFWKYVRRISIFNNVADVLLSKGRTNLSLACPLPVGTYVMRNIYVPPDTGILKYATPNTIYTFYGSVYSQLSNKSLVKKCSYEINSTVNKAC